MFAGACQAVMIHIGLCCWCPPAGKHMCLCCWCQIAGSFWDQYCPANECIGPCCWLPSASSSWDHCCSPALLCHRLYCWCSPANSSWDQCCMPSSNVSPWAVLLVPTSRFILGSLWPNPCSGLLLGPTKQRTSHHQWPCVFSASQCSVPVQKPLGDCCSKVLPSSPLGTFGQETAEALVLVSPEELRAAEDPCFILTQFLEEMNLRLHPPGFVVALRHSSISKRFPQDTHLAAICC